MRLHSILCLCKTAYGKAQYKLNFGTKKRSNPPKNCSTFPTGFSDFVFLHNPTLNFFTVGI